VVVAGPHTGERSALLHRLADEFPDVFAFPRRHTTFDPEGERRAHVAADGGLGVGVGWGLGRLGWGGGFRGVRIERVG